MRQRQQRQQQPSSPPTLPPFFLFLFLLEPSSRPKPYTLINPDSCCSSTPFSGSSGGRKDSEESFKAQELSNVAWAAATVKQLGHYATPEGLPEVIGRSVIEFDRSLFKPQARLH